MEYWKQQGWTESDKWAITAVNDLALMMDMTRRELLAKYRIYVKKTILQAEGEEQTTKRKAPVVTPVQPTQSKKNKRGGESESSGDSDYTAWSEGETDKDQ